MNTREVATAMRNTANYLDSLEEFDLESSLFFSGSDKSINASVSYWDKDNFVNAVKAIGNSTKKYDTDTEYPRLRVIAKDFPFEVNISRDKVCKKIVTFDCDPLFSAEEVEAL